MDFCDSGCCILWIYYFCFSVMHIYWLWEGQEALLLLVTPFYSHHCLVSLTQVRFWSLAPLQKKRRNNPEEMGQGERLHSQICWVLRSDFLSSPWRRKAFFTGTFKARLTTGRYQFWTSATATWNAQRTWLLATARSVWYFKGILGAANRKWMGKLIKPIKPEKKKKKYSPKVSIHDRLEKIAKTDPIL